MSGGILVAQAGHQSRGRKSQTGDDSGSPFDGDEIDRLSIGYRGLDTGDRSSVSAVDEDLDFCVDVGKSVGDARDLGLCARVDLHIKGVVEVARTHGTEAQEAITSGARVNGLANDLVAVCGNSEVENHIALHRGGRRHVHGNGVVIGRIDDIEQTGREAGIVLAGAERGCVKECVLGGHGSEQVGEGQEVDEEGRPLGQGAWKTHRECFAS